MMKSKRPVVIPGPDGRMRSGESEAHKSGDTSDNNAGAASNGRSPNRIENLAETCE